jgi:hypothetical protein
MLIDLLHILHTSTEGMWQANCKNSYLQMTTELLLLLEVSFSSTKGIGKKSGYQQS